MWDIWKGIYVGFFTRIYSYKSLWEPRLPLVTSKLLRCVCYCFQHIFLYVKLLQVKSDFIEALNKAENQARHYQSKFETLEDNFQKVGQYMLVEVAFHLIFSSTSFHFNLYPRDFFSFSVYQYILYFCAFALTVNLLQNPRGRNLWTNSCMRNRSLQLQKGVNRHSRNNFWRRSLSLKND